MALLRSVLLPLLLNDIYESERQVDDIYDQHFGLGLRDWDLASNSFNYPALRAGYLRPWRNLAQLESGISSIKSDDKEFSIRLDVNHFKPEELKVKVDNGHVVVQGKHEERSDEHGFIARQFTRRYKLPDDVNVDTLSSNLSSDGVLTLQAAKKPKETQAGREIDIVQTNKPARPQIEEPKKKSETEGNQKEEPQKDEEGVTVETTEN